jgi:hypothetical protein
MCLGLSNDLQQADDARKTAIIDGELAKRSIDITAKQETPLASGGSLHEKDYTFFWQGMEWHERRIYGVRFAVRISLLLSIEPPIQGTKSILSIRLTTSSGHTHIPRSPPPHCSTAEAKDAFYEELETRIREIPYNENLFRLGASQLQARGIPARKH